MKLSLAAATLVAARSASAICDSQLTIDVPSGVTGVSFVNYIVDPAKIVRSTGTVCSLLGRLNVICPMTDALLDIVSDLRGIHHA